MFRVTFGGEQAGNKGQQAVAAGSQASPASSYPRRGTRRMSKKAVKIERGMETAVTNVARQLNLYLPLPAR